MKNKKKLEELFKDINIICRPPVLLGAGQAKHKITTKIIHLKRPHTIEAFIYINGRILFGDTYVSGEEFSDQLIDHAYGRIYNYFLMCFMSSLIYRRTQIDEKE